MTPKLTTVTFPSIEKDGQYFTAGGAPVKKDHYSRYVDSLECLHPYERQQVWQQYLSLKEKLDKLPEILNYLKAEDIRQAQNDRDILENIIAYICQMKGIAKHLMAASTRKREVVYCRMLCMYVTLHRTRLSLKNIGARFGGRDHTTVLHTKYTIQNLMDVDKDLKGEVLFLLAIDYSNVDTQTISIQSKQLVA